MHSLILSTLSHQTYIPHTARINNIHITSSVSLQILEIIVSVY